MFRSSNPIFSRNDSFKESNPYRHDSLVMQGGTIASPAQAGETLAAADRDVTTVRGASIKFAFLLALCIASALGAAVLFQAQPGLLFPVTIAGFLVALVVGLVGAFWPKGAVFYAPVYAIAEGAALSGLSLIISASLGPKLGDGIIFQAVMLTLGIAAVCAIGFATGLLRISSTVAKVIMVATLGVGLTYLANLVLGMFGIHALGNAIHGTSMFGIGFSLFVVVLASANLVLDFQNIQVAADNRAPKYMEWYGAFGLLVTLAWLYIEVLRLLSKLRQK